MASAAAFDGLSRGGAQRLLLSSADIQYKTFYSSVNKMH
jgi:hypothetical protein